MTRRPPGSTRTYTLLPCTTRFRSTRRVRAFDVPASVVGVHPDVTLVFVEIEPVPVIHATPFGSSVAEKLPALFCQRIAERRSEEHTSELQSLMRISYAVFCLKKTTTRSDDKTLVLQTLLRSQ